MNEQGKDEVVLIHLDDIIPNRFQPREVFDEKALKELAVSIKEHGVIQPIIVRNTNGKYEIIAGERRYKASALAGLTKIPAIIRNLDDKESSKVALLENLQRKNLNAIEEARTYQKILEIDQMTQEELAKTMGKSQSAVANKIRLLSLPDEVQDALLKEKISERHARALINVPDLEKQKELLNKVIEEKLSVRKLEEENNNLYSKNKKEEATASANEFINSNPLSPVGVDIEENQENYGKVVIAPPQEEGQEERFINYGEINKEEQTTTIPDQPENVDVEKEKKVSQPLNIPENPSSLDSLLNIGQPTLTQAEKIDNEIIQEEKKNNDDYFQTPDLTETEQPSVDIFKEAETPVQIEPQQEVPAEADKEQDNKSENIPTIDMSDNISETKEESYTLEVSQEKIKSLIEELKNHGITISCDEMDFPETYQVIIKIAKQKVE